MFPSHSSALYCRSAYTLLQLTVSKTFHVGFIYSTEGFLNINSLPACLKNTKQKAIHLKWSYEAKLAYEELWDTIRSPLSETQRSP